MTIELFPDALQDARTTLLRMVERVEDDDVVFIILIKKNDVLSSSSAFRSRDLYTAAAILQAYAATEALKP